MDTPLRRPFHQELDDIDANVVQLFALVTESLSAATETFLASDRDLATTIRRREKVIDELNHDLEGVVERNLLLQAPVASELRFLISVLRIVPELERSGDLVEHIANRAVHGIGTELTPTVRGMVERMGRLGVEMWRMAADAYVERDGSAVERIDALDDELDDLHDQLFAELCSGSVPVKAAVEMALVARFYERLGDHALHITERVAYIASGRR